jgi:hypothetical protein
MAAVFTCPPGSICPPPATDKVGPNNTNISYISSTTVTQGSDGKVNGSERVLYIVKNDTYQPAAISKDGGKTYTFSDPKYPLMAGVAGADLQNDLNKPTSAIHKNADAGIAKVLPKEGIKPTEQQSVVASTANQAITGEIDSSIPGTGESVSGTFDKENQFGNLKYPANLANDKQDVIKFSMLKYLPSGVGATQPGGESARGGLKSGIPKGREIIGTTVLPIPNAISDSNLVSWGEDNMDAVKAALSAAAFSAITGGFSKGMENAGASLQAFAGESATGSFAAGTFAAAAAGGEGSKLLSRATGQVINPNLELLFNAPQLRPFSFTFKLAARSKEEGQTILKIINFFKRGMSPIRTDSNLFLKSPNTFAIEYLHMGATNPNIGRIKECALQSVTTSYTPEGQYATFSDGVMVSYSITMQFSELEPIFNSDYEGLSGIGY